MKWLQKVGVKGLKVDFLEAISGRPCVLKIFSRMPTFMDYDHLPRLYTLEDGSDSTNFVGSETVLASEMLIFSQDVREKEAFYATCTHLSVVC